MRRSLAQRIEAFWLDDAVTPVIGSILILAITVLGIGAILLWGAPTLQGIQDQNAQVGMVGEFQEMRRDTLVLSITDSSRVPRVNQETGSFGLVDGTRIQVSAMFDAANPACDLHVTGWEDATTDVFTFSADNCRSTDSVCDGAGSVQFEVFRVTGGNTVEIDPAGITFSGSAAACTVDLPDTEDVSTGDWRFRISDGGITVYADAWLLSTKGLDWSLESGSEYGVRLEGGAIFSKRFGTLFLEEDPAISEEAFGNTADYVLRIPTYSGTGSSFTGRGSPTVFLGLVGNHLRTSTETAYTVRYDFHGEFAQAWCNGIERRGGNLAEGAYTEDATFPCDGADGAIRALQYQRNGGADAFAFEFIHARITTSLQA